MSDIENDTHSGGAKPGRSLLQQYLWPLGFWKVKFAGKKRWMVLFPLIVACAAGLTFAYLPKANLAHDRGLLDISADLLSMLVGFFVAALGVVMAFPKGRIDARIPANANPPMIGNQALTWREFANRMTAYLVFVSLLTYAVATAVMVVHPGIDWDKHCPDFRFWMRVLGGAMYTALFAHVLSVTLFSLFWIAGKMAEAQWEPNVAVKPGAPASPIPVSAVPRNKSDEPS